MGETVPITIVACEYDRGFTAGKRGDEPQAPASCTCLDSWLAGYRRGRAVRQLRRVSGLA